MGKILFLALAAVVIYWLLRGYARKQRDIAPPKEPAGAEDMVRCAHCQVNVPRSEAIFSRGQYFCTDEHRKLAP